MATRLVATALAAALVFVGAASDARAQNLTIVGGSPGGAYLKAAAALGEYAKLAIPGVSVTVMPGGGWSSVERLDPGSKLADVAVLENDLASIAYKGEGPTGKKYDFRMIGAFRGPSIAQAPTVKASGITSFEQIRDKKMPVRIVTFERHQLATSQALDLMAAYGLTPELIQSWGGKMVFTSQAEGVRMMMEGQADMWISGSSVWPSPAYVELGTKHAFTLLPISKDVATKVGAKYGQKVMEVPADIYKDANGSNQPYWSPVTILAFSVRTDLADDIVYKLTKALEDNKEQFYLVHESHRYYDPKKAWQEVGIVPLHPGATKYYKDKGYMP
ncbi:MAG: TAXI family TRAP transporter solute-binding subunit [Alphaproteobacteria bacterium]|nr:TAXI family TRAP transporter solute-binding subunit [Alphaproteobacteria bacterium]